MCLPITLCCFFSSKYKLAFFQMLLSHWSIKIWLISHPYLRGLLNTFPKWYDIWNSDENWAFYGQKTEELCFCQKFWKNFRGLFGALKLEIFLKKRYFGVTLDRHYLILRSKSKSKKLTAHLLFFGPLSYLLDLRSYCLFLHISVHTNNQLGKDCHALNTKCQNKSMAILHQRVVSWI